MGDHYGNGIKRESNSKLRISFKRFAENFLAILIAGVLGVIFTYFASEYVDETDLIRGFAMSVIIFFVPVRAGIDRVHSNGLEGITLFLELAFISCSIFTVFCGFMNIDKQVILKVFRIIDIVYFTIESLNRGDDSKTQTKESNTNANSGTAYGNSTKQESNDGYNYGNNGYYQYDKYGNGSSYSYSSTENNSGASKERDYSYRYDDDDDDNKSENENTYGYYHNSYTQQNRKNNHYQSNSGSSYGGSYYNGSNYSNRNNDSSSNGSYNNKSNNSNGSSNSSNNSHSTQRAPTRAQVEAALRVFGMSSPFTKAQIRKRRNALINLNHPDHGGSNEKAIEINNAYDILKSTLTEGVIG